MNPSVLSKKGVHLIRKKVIFFINLDAYMEAEMSIIILFAVPIFIPRGSRERPLQLGSHTWLDG